jgi:hypothetical protein
MLWRGWRVALAAVIVFGAAAAAGWAWTGREGVVAVQPSRPTVSARPGPGTVGVPSGTDLVPVRGGLRVTQKGAVVDGKDIAGPVVVAAPDVQIKRSRIVGDGSADFGIIVESGDVTVSDTEVYGFRNGIGFDNWAAYRIDLHDVSDDGVKLGSNVVLEDSWIHDLTPAADAHADGGQMQGGSRNLVVRGNVIDVTSRGGSLGNAALFLAPDLGPSSDGPVVIADNWLNGGNYTLYCVDGNNGEFYVRNIAITGNRFGRDFNYGPATVNVPVHQDGNVYDDTGEPVQF